MAAAFTLGSSVISDAEVMADPASEQVDPRRTKDGRPLDGKDGVLEWRISIRLPRDTGCTSGTPFRNEKVLTWTVLSLSGIQPDLDDVPITALRSNVLIQRIPCNTLNVVGVFAQGEDTLSCVLLASISASMCW